MDQNKNLSNEPGKTPGSSGISGTTGATGSTGGRTGGSSPSSSSPSSGSPSSGNPSSGSPGGGAMGQSSGGYSGGQTTSSAPQRAREPNTGGQSTYDQTIQSVTDAYGKTTEVLSKTYDEAMSYGRDNPGKLTLIAFGAGIAIGLLLSGAGGRSRTNRMAEPVVNALSQVALEFFR